MFVRRILVGDRERVLVIRKGRFLRILAPGEYTFWTLGQSMAFEVCDVKSVVFESTWADVIVKEHRAVCDANFTILETSDAQVAVVRFDGKLARVIGPGKRVLFWRGPVAVTAEVIDVKQTLEVPEVFLSPLSSLGASTVLIRAQVEDGKTGLLYLDNRFVRALTPGAYGFWNVAGTPRVDIVDLRRQTLEIPGQEILTKDKVSIRVNVWSEYQVADAVKAKQSVKDFSEYLYRVLQLAVRQTLGRRTLEEILAEKVDIDESVAAEVRQEAEKVGILVRGIALKDVVLPGEMREILNQVVTAEKQAQANLIRRREETAATRSLLNTAKLMEGNPLLVRLKELETLEKVAEKVGTITIHGGTETLLGDLVTIRDRK